MKLAIKFLESKFGLRVFVKLRFLLLAGVDLLRRTDDIVALLLLPSLSWRLGDFVGDVLALFRQLHLLAPCHITSRLKARSCNSITIIISLALVLGPRRHCAFDAWTKLGLFIRVVL